MVHGQGHMEQSGVNPDISIGVPVSAIVPETGYVVEGNVIAILPYGCEFIDPTWNDESIVIEDHETKLRSHWRPQHVTVLGDDAITGGNIDSRGT